MCCSQATLKLPLNAVVFFIHLDEKKCFGFTFVQFDNIVFHFLVVEDDDHSMIIQNEFFS